MATVQHSAAYIAASSNAHDVLTDIPPHQRKYLRDLVRIQGGISAARRWFENREWLNAMRIDDDTAAAVRRGLRVHELAEIEIALGHSAMGEAKRVLRKIAKRAKAN